MDEVLIAAKADEVRLLLGALDRADVRYVLVERAAGVEQAARGGRVSLLIVSDSVCDRVLRSRLRRDHPSRHLIGWLSRPSTQRAAELIEEGAVDVLDSTMGARELLARLHNASARAAAAPAEALELGSLSIDAAQGTARFKGVDLGLSRREREVLLALAGSPGRALRREEIYRQVWGFAMARGDRSVDVNVKRIRDKLAAAGAVVVIATQPGVGYRLELPTPNAEPAVTAL